MGVSENSTLNSRILLIRTGTLIFGNSHMDGRYEGCRQSGSLLRSDWMITVQLRFHGNNDQDQCRGLNN